MVYHGFYHLRNRQESHRLLADDPGLERAFFYVWYRRKQFQFGLYDADICRCFRYMANCRDSVLILLILWYYIWFYGPFSALDLHSFPHQNSWIFRARCLPGSSWCTRRNQRREVRTWCDGTSLGPLVGSRWRAGHFSGPIDRFPWIKNHRKGLTLHHFSSFSWGLKIVWFDPFWRLYLNVNPGVMCNCLKWLLIAIFVGDIPFGPLRYFNAIYLNPPFVFKFQFGKGIEWYPLISIDIYWYPYLFSTPVRAGNSSFLFLRWMCSANVRPRRVGVASPLSSPQFRQAVLAVKHWRLTTEIHVDVDVGFWPNTWSQLK